MAISFERMIDLTPWIRQSSSGVGITAWRSFRALHRLDSRVQAGSRSRGGSFHWIHPLERLMGKRSRLYHSFEHRMPPLIKGLRLLSIHDLWTLSRENTWQPPEFQARQSPLLVQSIQRAHWITTPSRAVLRQLHERFPETRGRSQSVAWGPTIPDEWLHRDPHERGASVGLGASAHPELQGLTTRPYFLTVANIENRKNLLLLPQALEGLSGFDWVFAGRAGYGSSEIMRQLQEFASRSKLRFHFLQELRTEALMQLYQGCVGVVLPSFDEGFGLPALEGASLGRPLILSNIEPFREIALDAALYFDPIHGAEALRAHVLQLLEDSALQRRLAAQAALRSQYFSWERTAKAFLEIYDKMERA